MDLLSACESLAANVMEYKATDASDLHIPESDIERWRFLFEMTRAEAIEEITNWRLDFGRESLSQDAWEALKGSKSAAGFNKESYEYNLARGRKLKQDTVTSSGDTGMYLLRIQEPFPSVQTIQHLLNTNKVEIVTGLDDEGRSVQFCYMTAQMKSLLEHNLATSGNNHLRPSFLRVSIARKNLSDSSRYPTLGIDSTFPQYRAQAMTESFRPAQNEYPVRYFFYGTLADRAVLARILGIENAGIISYEHATVRRGALTSWANRYKGLVDGDEDDEVEGKVYWVKCREDEEALRIYETAKYEVVRCIVHLQSEAKTCMGLTFRLLQDIKPQN
ncbi:hypothetical protein V2A60_003183 [Cordyceps javanica]|uniref:Putative gamma-glutamylcyclotransferase n=1 Tax=Cordyceps javanica TaxID=43265 RepID=A0A545W159_9HYPO|nr:oxidoreductase domain-containing protein [Cordyceps javanica]TQW07704.1 oxidoreductase domain containing protein [Cordyceps javanica]